MKIDILEGKCIKYELVGSRVTCDPAPTDTDQDVLVLVDPEQWALYLEPLLRVSGFDKGGSDVGDSSGYLAQTPLSFQSYTFEELNLIVTFDPEFYKRFQAATAVAKRLNLLVKDDRVMLFQAVLYGNKPLPAFSPFDLVPLAPMLPSVGPYWVAVEGRGSVCVEALSPEAASNIASNLMQAPVLAVDKLPYPATPRLNPYSHPSHGVCPSFCYAPSTCKGRGCCPMSPSCVD